MIYTVILSLYALTGAAICAFLVVCCTHTDYMEKHAGKSLDELRDLKLRLTMIPSEKMWIASLATSLFVILFGVVVMIGWPVLLLVLRRMK